MFRTPHLLDRTEHCPAPPRGRLPHHLLVIVLKALDRRQPVAFALEGEAHGAHVELNFTVVVGRDRPPNTTNHTGNLSSGPRAKQHARPPARVHARARTHARTHNMQLHAYAHVPKHARERTFFCEQHGAGQNPGWAEGGVGGGGRDGVVGRALHAAPAGGDRLGWRGMKVMHCRAVHHGDNVGRHVGQGKKASWRRETGGVRTALAPTPGICRVTSQPVQAQIRKFPVESNLTGGGGMCGW